MRLYVLALAMAAPAFAGTADAVSKSLALFTKAGAEWKAGCLSCHHQSMAMLALESARRHGIPVDEEAARTHVSRTLAPMLTSVQGLLGMPIDAFAMGYGMLAAHADGIAPNLVTSVVARKMANWQLPDGHWAASDARPPASASDFTATALAVRAIALYRPDAAAAARARHWLAATPPRSTEDRAFQVLGLVWAGASDAERKPAVDALFAARRADGGWAQETGMDSDAYATGEAVYALRVAGVPVDELRKSVRFLLDTQREDGSWLTRTRLHSPAPISPPFFDSGFPGGRDQYASFAATVWAVMGLLETMPVAAAPARPLPIAAAPRDPQPWMERALFGSVDDLSQLLADGIPAQKILPFVLPDAAKTKLLLERGAKADDRSVAIAASYRESAAAIRLLLAAGAKATPEALNNAAGSGDVEAARALLAAGVPAGPALSTAVMSNRVEMARLLAGHGADVNARGSQGMTPLILAALMHRTQMVAALLDLGADPATVDDFGYTALRHTGDIAFADPETARLLEKAARTSAIVYR